MNLYQQYSNVKNQYSDALLFYRVGDFYELFGQDAITASEALSLTLTGRDCGLPERVPMCGVPYHNVEQYIKKLIEAGYKTAICEPSKAEPKKAADEPRGRLNLIAIGKEQTILKDYLEANASDVLIEKINNGISIVKDGKSLLSKKDLETFMKYACEEAQKQAEKGARYACIDHQTVFDWLIHYFEEDSIIGTLYNDDGTEYKPKPVPRTNTARTATPIITAKPKSNPQATLFDLMNWQTTTAADGAKTEEIELEAADEPEIDESEVEEPETEEMQDEEDCPKGLHQISETEYADEDGVVYEFTETKKENIPSILTSIFGSMLVMR